MIRGEEMISRYIRGAERLAVLAAIGLGQFPAGSQAPLRPPQSIFGTYGQSSPGRDSVQISGKANGKIGVAIRLYFSNGHTCRLNADGEWRDDHVAIAAEGLSAARPCKLNVFFDKGRALLKDEGYQCAPVYCGTRGKLDDVSLPKSIPGR
jgi:hypothetical protein